MTQHTLLLPDFPRPGLAQTLSPNGRAHWADKHRARKAVEDHVAAAALNRRLPPMIGHVTLQPTWVVPVTRRRDGDNLTAMLKPVIDVLVRLHLLVDDTTDILTILPPLVRVEPGRRALILEFSSDVRGEVAAYQPIGGRSE